jgi:hypothetical protein
LLLERKGVKGFTREIKVGKQVAELKRLSRSHAAVLTKVQTPAIDLFLSIELSDS